MNSAERLISLEAQLDEALEFENYAEPKRHQGDGGPRAATILAGGAGLAAAGKVGYDVHKRYKKLRKASADKRIPDLGVRGSLQSAGKQTAKAYKKGIGRRVRALKGVFTGK